MRWRRRWGKQGWLTHHDEGEHETAWPALQAVGVSKTLLETLDAEHETMAARRCAFPS